MNTKSGWWILGIALCAFAAAIAWQHRALGTLKEKLSKEKSEATSLASVRDENRRLLARLPSDAERRRLAAAAAEMPKAHEEVVRLREIAAQAKRAEAERQSSPETRFAVGCTQRTADCVPSGAATPQAALETALWACTGGNIDAFAKSIQFMNGRDRRAAVALMESLPAAMRSQLDSPEKMIAFLTIPDVPLGTVKVRDTKTLEGWPSPAVRMSLLFKAENDKAKESNLLLMQTGADWKLLVTEAVVAKYAAALRQGRAAPAP